MKKKTSNAGDEYDGPDGNASDIRTPHIPILNELHLKEGALWVEEGEEIDKFITEGEKLGLKLDLYLHLAKHPDALCCASQYRNYHACFCLWKKLGGEGKAPKVSMTHFIQILGKNLGWGEKKELLLAAQNEKLSVRELKERIQEKTGQGKANPPKRSWDWTVTQLVAATERTFQLASWLMEIRQSHTIPDQVREHLDDLVRLFIAQKLIDWEELKAKGDDSEEAV